MLAALSMPAMVHRQGKKAGQWGEDEGVCSGQERACISSLPIDYGSWSCVPDVHLTPVLTEPSLFPNTSVIALFKALDH